MKIALILFVLLLHVTLGATPPGYDTEDNEFADFENFDEPEEAVSAKPPVVGPIDTADDNADVEEAIVEGEGEDDYEHFHDSEEFEGFDNEGGKMSPSKDRPDLKITNVPEHLHTSWDSYYLELLMISGLLVYSCNFMVGKGRNHSLAQAWFNAHKDMLESNFALVGDDGLSTEPTNCGLVKESESIYALWCSGRTCCEGMLVTLRLLKRQDLVSTISRFLKPVNDQIVIKVSLDQGDQSVDKFVMCVANKKIANKMHKDLSDLNVFCSDKRQGETFQLPSSFQVLSEISEATFSVLDQSVTAAFNRYHSMIEYMHISDQYSGPKATEETSPVKPPEVSRVLLFCFNVPSEGRRVGPEHMEMMRPMLQLVFYVINKIRKVRLSRDAKVKSSNHRSKVEKSFQKASHNQRQEAAQARREEKRRLEKEKIMNEEDPEKQRKWEERDNKKQAKRKQPKMKMMKVKAM